ncbi:hypothetical protein CRYUN_Cryun15aG0067600 [Craigia yunnanensis]
MFFDIVLERNMQLHPRHFDSNLRENLVSKLMKDVWALADDMEFQSGDIMPNYTTYGLIKIQKDSEVRLIGTQVDATEILCIGTKKDDFLDVINDPTTTA